MGIRLASILLAFATVALFSGAAVEASISPHRFQTGFHDDQTFAGPAAATGFQRAAEAGATIERLIINWAAVAPVRPADATDPDDPAYRWSQIDAEVAGAIAAGQEPIANIIDTPPWARSDGGTYPTTYPDPAEFADFASAAAQRYDGVHEPRIAFWEIFNEPNLGLFLEPQFVNGQPESAIWYRDVLNRSVPRIKAVHGDNLVAAGSTAPYYDVTPSTLAVNRAWGPLGFLRAVLCLTPQLTPDTSQPGCTGPVAFDAWSHHPYTEGAPTREATLADDVELGDLPKLKRVLDAGWAAGKIAAAAPPEIWATEFSWNASPTDPGGVPASLLDRWIPEAMHLMWSNGVTMLTWFQLVDLPSPYQTGFYTSQAAMVASQPKPFLEAFRFPFVAYPSAGAITYWGRTPSGAQGTVAVEQDDGSGGWTELGEVTSDADGIVEGSFPTSSPRDVRARLTATGEASVAFSLTPVPDQFFPSFGKYQFEPSPPPPETTMNAAPAGTLASQSASFAFSSSTSPVRFECSLDGGTFAACTSPTTYAGLAAGARHTFAVRAVDLFGSADPSPATASWNVAGPASSGGGGGGGGGGSSSGLAPDIAVSLGASSATAPAVGSGLDFYVTVDSRNGGGATDVVLNVALPANFSYQSYYADRGSCSQSGVELTCDAAFINRTSSTHVRISGTVAQEGPLDLAASAQSQLEPEFDPSNNAATLKLLPASTGGGGGDGGGGSPHPVLRALKAPAVSGRPHVGATLRATPATWSTGPARVRYQWQLCTTSGCKPIPGASRLTLKLVRAYLGRSVRILAIAQGANATLESTSKRVVVRRR